MDSPTSVVESPSDREVVNTRTFAAPRDLVFQAFTDAKHLARWWGPACFTNPVCEVDARPGGSFRVVMRSPEGEEFPFRGIYQEVTPPERIVYINDHSGLSEEWQARLRGNLDGAGGGKTPRALTTLTFEEIEGGTKFTLRTLFESAAMRDAMLKMGAAQGWSQSLDKLQTLLSEA